MKAPHPNYTVVLYQLQDLAMDVGINSGNATRVCNVLFEFWPEDHALISREFVLRRRSRWDAIEGISKDIGPTWRLLEAWATGVGVEEKKPEFKPAVTGAGKHIVLIGDIVTGFEAYGPFDSGHDAITWKSSTGVREMAHGQWYLMELKEPIKGRD